MGAQASGSRDESLARKTGGFLLDLYGMSRSLPVEQFQRSVLERLRVALPFRSAFWGVIRADASLTVHRGTVDALPAEFLHHWEAIKHKDDLASRVIARPGVATSVHTYDLAHRDFHAMGERFGIENAMSVAHVGHAPDLYSFLSLYRDKGESRFDRSDRCFEEIVLPHLSAAWHANWLAHLERLRAGLSTPRRGFAVIDRHGLIHVSDPSFIELVRSEWPCWNGFDLPLALTSQIFAGRACSTRLLSFGNWRHHDLAVVQARPRSVLDRLSPRESEIVMWYREGLSYKEIARELGCSPFTVRHHLRAIYEKLGVSSRTAMARLMEDTDAS